MTRSTWVASTVTLLPLVEAPLDARTPAPAVDVAGEKVELAVHVEAAAAVDDPVDDVAVDVGAAGVAWGGLAWRSTVLKSSLNSCCPTDSWAPACNARRTA